MNFSEFLSLGALIVAILAYWQSRRVQSTQSQLTDREIQLVRVQLSKAEQEERERKTADVSAKLYRVDRRNWKLRVFNKGPATARNVTVTVDEENTILSREWIEGKFPMSEMEAGASVDITATVVMGSKSKEPVYLTWADGTGHTSVKTVEITI